MKILLIYPFFISKRIHVEEIQSPPLGLYYIGAALKKKGHDVEIMNWGDAGDKPDMIRKALLEKQPDILGFSVLNANRWGAISIARLAREIDPEIRIVLGGVGATFLWDHLLSHFPWVDFIILGEGEITFEVLADRLGKGGEDNVSEIAGIAYRGPGGPVMNPPRGFIRDLDTLADPSLYFDFDHLASSRGCPWQCSFCGSPMFWNRKVRFHSPVYFVNQLERICLRGKSFFFFSDDTFTLKKERVIEICRLIIDKKLNITWFAISRVDCVDEEMLEWMRRAGCIQISYGVESGSCEIRSVLNKQIEEESVIRAFSLTKRYGILPRAYFIYGSPGETASTIRKSLELVDKIKPLSAIFYILALYPGTSLYEAYLKHTGLTDELWLNPIEDIMYFETDNSLSRELVMEYGETLRRHFWNGLASSAQSIDLIDSPHLYPHHADFLSRLAMTFTHGEYSRNQAIPDKEKTAEILFLKALTYHDDQRAYLGLAILKQRQGRYEEALPFCTRGLELFPESESLRMCLGITYINLKRFEEALRCFTLCDHSPRVDHYLGLCEKALRKSPKQN